MVHNCDCGILKYMKGINREGGILNRVRRVCDVIMEMNDID